MSATQTTNLGLNKPARTDFVSVVTDINDNMDILDSVIGAIPSDSNVKEMIDGKAEGTTYNGLDKTASGFVLDARQGKILDDKVSDVNSAIGTVPTGKTLQGEVDTLHDTKSDAINITDTTAESVKSFSDGADGMPMEIVVEIEPVQDTHGLDPYPPGGGKNKLSVNEFSLSKPSERIKAIEIEPIPAGTYLLSWVYSGTSTSTSVEFRKTESGSSTAYLLSSGDNPKTVTLTDTANYMYCYISNNQSDGVTSSVSNIMLRLSTESDGTFAPYSNICPITGWTGAKVTRTGKNLFDKNGNLSQIYIGSDGSVGTSQYARTTDYIYLPDGKATFSAVTIASTSSNIRLALYDANKVFKQRIVSTAVVLNQRTSITVDNSEIKYVRATIYINSEDIDTAQLEYGTVVTAYKPFGTTYTIQFGETVYGGTLKINKDGSGLLTVDRKQITFSERDDWSLNTTYNVFYLSHITDKKDGYEILSSDYRVVEKTYKILANGEIAGTVTDGLNVKDDRYSTVEAFLEGAGNSQVVYELATPVTYSLTAEQVTTLLGVNNLWCDTGTVLTMEYPADTKLYVDQGNTQQDAEITATKGIIGDSMGSTASRAIGNGKLFIMNNKLYRATAHIANGAAITPNTNCVETGLDEEIAGTSETTYASGCIIVSKFGRTYNMIMQRDGNNYPTVGDLKSCLSSKAALNVSNQMFVVGPYIGYVKHSGFLGAPWDVVYLDNGSEETATENMEIRGNLIWFE